MQSFPYPRPGTPDDELIHKLSGKSKTSVTTADPIQDESLKHLGKLNNSSHLKYFQNAYEKQDMHLKKKMELALSSIRKREELDKQYKSIIK